MSSGKVHSWPNLIKLAHLNLVSWNFTLTQLYSHINKKSDNLKFKHPKSNNNSDAWWRASNIDIWCDAWRDISHPQSRILACCWRHRWAGSGGRSRKTLHSGCRRSRGPWWRRTAPPETRRADDKTLTQTDRKLFKGSTSGSATFLVDAGTENLIGWYLLL